MAQPSPSYTVALHLEVPASQKAVTTLVDTASATGAIVNGVDVADTDGDTLIVDLTADTRDSKHRGELVEALKALEGVTVHNVGDSTFLAHVGGKVEIAPRTPIPTAVTWPGSTPLVWLVCARPSTITPSAPVS